MIAVYYQTFEGEKLSMPSVTRRSRWSEIFVEILIANSCRQLRQWPIDSNLCQNSMAFKFNEFFFVIFIYFFLVQFEEGRKRKSRKTQQKFLNWNDV